MNASYAVKLNVKRMKKLEKKYMALKTREQEDMVELRRLRTNKLLLHTPTASVAQLQDDLMIVRLREAESLADAKESRQNESEESEGWPAKS
ncbi:hypothetical protein BV898_14979 [Hypsibius exemplaris]|uniref:Uncharacterized protein n=1 Tax=Hypsibius exemplaris TaxID=2072580 RepID=A0A9X6RK05_HYPEX|nr:hypothetical protein BV898_14979 [Hypsibius exemplaris]